MAEVILAQETGTGGPAALGDYGGIEYRSRQSFTLDDDTSALTKIKVTFTANTGSPTGNVTFRIETNTGGDEASGTLVHANATSTFAITPSAENTVDYTDFSLVAGTYWIVLNCDNQDNAFFGVSYNATGAYTGGDRAYTADGAWIDVAGQDLTFKVYGEEPAPPSEGGLPNYKSLLGVGR